MLYSFLSQIKIMAQFFVKRAYAKYNQGAYELF